MTDNVLEFPVALYKRVLDSHVLGEEIIYHTGVLGRDREVTEEMNEEEAGTAAALDALATQYLKRSNGMYNITIGTNSEYFNGSGEFVLYQKDGKDLAGRPATAYCAKRIKKSS